MLNIALCQGNTNQNHTEIPPHTSQSGQIEQIRRLDAGEDVEKRNPLALLVGMQTGAASLENSVEVPQNIKNRSTLCPNSSTARNLPKGYRNADA